MANFDGLDNGTPSFEIETAVSPQPFKVELTSYTASTRVFVFEVTDLAANALSAAYLRVRNDAGVNILGAIDVNTSSAQTITINASSVPRIGTNFHVGVFGNSRKNLKLKNLGEKHVPHAANVTVAVPEFFAF